MEVSETVQRLLHIFRDCAPDDMIGGMRMEEWRKLVTESMERNERLLREQAIHPGLGGREVYRASLRK